MIEDYSFLIDRLRDVNSYRGVSLSWHAADAIERLLSEFKALQELHDRLNASFFDLNITCASMLEQLEQLKAEKKSDREFSIPERVNAAYNAGRYAALYDAIQAIRAIEAEMK